MKKIISLGSVLATVVLLGAGCNININETPTTPPATNNNVPVSETTTNTATENTNNTTVVETTTVETTTQTNSITYTNPEFHFSLTLPATWTGYTTKTTENTEGGKTVWFGFAGWDEMFTISIHPTEVNPHPNMRYFGTDGQVYYYGGQSQYIKIESLDARWREISTIMDSFTVANLTNGTENWKVYANTDYNFQIKYPTTYKAVYDNYGWKNAVVLFLEDAPGAQSYSASVSIWNTLEEYTNETNYNAMAYSYYKVGEKYVVLSYFSSEDGSEWQKVAESFKKTN
ncbi:MAG: hypothetical protein PHQ18_00450 [Patescibacteria group bacterium]|nr:hypothetical protein [Patescibacteria group bacterium]